MVKISKGVERAIVSAAMLGAVADNTISMKQYTADIAYVVTEQSQGVAQINLVLRPMEQVT